MLVDGRELRRSVLAEHRVVIADHRDVLRNTPSHTLTGVDRSHRHEVVAAENRCWCKIKYPIHEDEHGVLDRLNAIAVADADDILRMEQPSLLHDGTIDVLLHTIGIAVLASDKENALVPIAK